MRKLTKNYIRKLIVEEFENQSKLIEGEDDDASADPFATDDAEEPAEGEEDSEEPAEDEADEEDADAADDEEDEDTVTGPTDFQIDNEINAVMADFESEALQVAQAQNESKNSRLSLTRALLEVEEGEEVAIDIDNFTQNVARLIGNYQNLIDMEQVIFNKSKDFLTDKYGEEVATQLEDILATRYDISVEHEPDAEEAAAPAYAVGAANAQA
jgi:hypothetical protein